MSQPKRASARRRGRSTTRAAAETRPKPTGASRLGSRYEAGRATREAIVRTALEVLIQSGQAGFTVERVAKKLGISPGNVNYYFPTKASLLETLILFTLGEYRRRVRGAGEQFNTGTREGLTDVLRWLMEDAISLDVYKRQYY